MYNDGDVEKLNLRKEKWTIIQDDSGPNKVCICSLKIHLSAHLKVLHLYRRLTDIVSLQEQEVAEESRESTPEMYSLIFIFSHFISWKFLVLCLDFLLVNSSDLFFFGDQAFDGNTKDEVQVQQEAFCQKVGAFS